MSQHDSPAGHTKQQSDSAERIPPESGELDEELSRFAHRLAGFGLGEALDALLARRDLDDTVVQPNPDPEPC